MTKHLLFVLSFCIMQQLAAQPKPAHNLVFDAVATRWDEGIPLGNGWLGALIWKKENKIRLSLDRVDLWDDRPMPDIDKLTFSWVVEKVKLNQYDSVQKIGDEPYEKYAAPTKIPGAAIEFDLSKFGKVISNELDIATALSTIKFENGASFFNYVHASKQVGYFGFENLPAADIIPALMIPAYNSGKAGGNGNSVEGQGLERLGYKKGTVTKTATSIRYHQPTWNGNYYEVLISWKKFTAKHIIGQWTITVNKPAVLPQLVVSVKEPTGWGAHIAWWKDYWGRSSVSLADTDLEKQYYLEMYKFGCVARSNTPPISLQAIWTADNGNLPPWKGDYHHDLNTQLSYWPGYTGNHLDLTASYTSWLWKIKETNKRWTKKYFGVDGLNVPGVTTISGKEMGGWIQYSMSPTTAAWLAQHFYWQWKYSMDENFLKKICRPYFDEVENYFFKVRIRNASTGKYTLPLSSSPEYNDNSIKAWFKEYTNYDLALIKNMYNEYAGVLEKATGRNPKEIFLDSQLYPELNTNETGLTIAPGQNLEESHRHHAQLVAIYPLALVSPDEPAQKQIINSSLRWLEKMGTRNWCGYSFSWAACIYARAREADSAANMLKIFASNFCSPNSFHLNGDQKGGQYSSFTYRPFTLEGNFAFAQGVHEMLIQSYNGYIEIFPAVPRAWKDVSFHNLRTEGAFLVSAKKENGVPAEVTIAAEQGGLLQIKQPFKTWLVTGVDRTQIHNDGDNILTVTLKKGQTITFKKRVRIKFILMNRRDFIKYTTPVIILLANGKIVQASETDPYEWSKRKIKLRFAVASDGHYGQPNTAFEEFHTTLVNRVNEEHAANPFAFCMINGDIIHDDKKHYPGAKAALSKLQMPWYVSQGNHDHVTADEWKTIWNIPVNHDFTIKKNTFLIATTSDDKGTYLPPDVPWIADKLEKHKNQEHVFIFLHINPGKQTVNAVDCPPLFDVLAKYKNVKAVFNGHDHDEEGIKVKNNIPFIFDAHFGGNWGTTYRGFRVVELLKDNSIATYILNPTEKINAETL